MVDFEEALDIVMKNTLEPHPETVALDSAFGRIVSRDIASDIDIPRADMAAMDGFALRRADVDKPLRIIETIPAGHQGAKSIGAGECSRIMTGAPVPAGADCVVMVEYTEVKDGFVSMLKRSGADNIRRKAEDVSAGEVVVRAGARITPAIIAILASAGQTMVPVNRRPRVGIMATGDELVPVPEMPSVAQIRDCNSHLLGAMVRGCGCVPGHFGIARDTPEATEMVLRRALASSDVLLLSGGVSAGDFDFVPDTILKLGGEILVKGVSIKPGKPLVFATLDGKKIFGMPGNPVASLVVFELFVREYLYKCLGHYYEPRIVEACLEEPISRKKADRMEFLPVCFRAPGTVSRPVYHGSAHIHGFRDADGIVSMAEGVDRIDAGSKVQVRMLEKC